jgi:glycosyltransferase involved in cell wall biosynthesis
VEAGADRSGRCSIFAVVFPCGRAAFPAAQGVCLGDHSSYLHAVLVPGGAAKRDRHYDSRAQFDKYFEDFAPRFLPARVRWLLGMYISFAYVLRRARVAHFTFLGFVLGCSRLWWVEAYFFKLAGIKTVIIPFGADGYMVSELTDTTLRYALLAARPQFARIEYKTKKKTSYWMKHVDIIVGSWMVEGLGRWDVTIHQPRIVDTNSWTAKTEYSPNDGRAGSVKVVHAPSSRRFKGTEFVIDAVDRLRAEGLSIELILIENVPNDQVGQRLREGDIMIEQVFFVGYAISALEGLACGLPMICNLEHEAYTRVFRRVSFLDECPVVSGTPESLTDTLRTLVTNPQLREKLGRASRAFAEKYHSYDTARHTFGAIYDHLLFGKDVDLIGLYHPLLSEFNRRSPKIDHPLVESKIPQMALDTALTSKG